MASTYTYTIKIKDLLSKGILRASKNTKGAFEGMNSSNRGFRAGVNRTSNTITGLRNRISSLQDARDRSFDRDQIKKFNLEIRKSERQLRKLENLPPRSFISNLRSIPGLVRGIGASLGVGFGIAGINALKNEIQNVQAEFEGLKNAIDFTMDSSQEGSKTMKYLREESDRLGLSQIASERGFKTLSASIKNLNVPAEKQRKIFSQVSTAMTVMNLNAEAQQGSWLALGQIMSKGKVQAEELRGQLGERIPGAFGIAAKAMGVTEAKLNNMLDRGEIIADEFLPRFAQELENTFKGGLDKATRSLTSNINRQENKLLNLKRTLGNDLRPAMLWWLKAQGTGLDLLKTGIGFLKENSAAIKGLAVSAGIAAGGFGLYTIAMKASIVWAFALKIANLGLAGSIRAVGIAIMANPIGFAIGIIAALAGAIVWAWNRFEGFRGAMYGLWDATKTVFGNIKTTALKVPSLIIEAFKEIPKAIQGVFKNTGKLFKAIFTGNFKAIPGILKDIGGDLIKTNPLLGPAVKIGKELGNGVGESYKKGFQKGIKGFQKDKEGSTNEDGVGSDPFNPVSSNSGGDSITAGIAGVNGGGSGGARNVTINIEKMVETMSFNGGTLNNQIKDAVRDMQRLMLNMVNNANLAAIQ